ncbi:hypothetical protein Vafri_5731, partial [Volvox africanus]
DDAAAAGDLATTEAVATAPAGDGEAAPEAAAEALATARAGGGEAGAELADPDAVASGPAVNRQDWPFSQPQIRPSLSATPLRRGTAAEQTGAASYDTDTALPDADADVESAGLTTPVPAADPEDDVVSPVSAADDAPPAAAVAAPAVKRHELPFSHPQRRPDPSCGREYTNR